MICKEIPRTNVSKLTTLFLFGLVACSCTIRSTGGYVTGEGNTEFLEPVHATAVEVLTPTLNNNYCFMRKEWQLRRYNTRERLIEVNGETVNKSKNYKYEFSNKCE